MDFDPLSLFTPRQDREYESEQWSPSNKLEELEKSEVQEVEKEQTEEDPIDEDDAFLEPLHILEFPLLVLKPTAAVLLVILRLLSPDQVFNFSPQAGEHEEVNEVQEFELRNVTLEEVADALTWLEKYCARFNTSKKLSYLPKLSETLKVNYLADYNAYLTNIISNELAWIEDSKLKESISKEACLRLSENCGRNAQPDIIRKINIPKLVPYLNKEKYILLSEPSLTSDNLGLKTWGSSLVLSNRLANRNTGYLLDNVLELGSGTGLVGMVSALLGFETTLTDLKEITPNLKHNLELNHIDSEVHELDWCDPSSFIEKYGNVQFNTLLISDPIYSSQHPFWIINMIDKFFNKSNPEARVLLQLPVRRGYEEERNVLWGLFDDHGYYEVEQEIEDGFDDFGEMQFCFKMYKKRNIT